MFGHGLLAFRDLLARVTRWSTETIVIFLAFGFFPTLIAVGTVVDYWSANKYKAAIQVALDAALLAGERNGQTNWTDIALNTFNVRLSSKYDLRPKPTFVQDPSTGNYIGAVSASWPTSALGILNIGSIGVKVTAVAIADREDAFILNRDDKPPESNVWSVNRLSGDASLTTSAGQQATLREGAILSRGDNIRTSPNGRVLLMRGQESILIAPNSIVGIATHATEGMSTTINQWAGSIVLAVEKRNHPHFEVDTPYLAAVVRGTRFQVTVNKEAASVKVLRGQVEVTDFKSSEHALVLSGQAAATSAQGTVGISLSGRGPLSPVWKGLPRLSSSHPAALSDRYLFEQNDTLNERRFDTPPKVENEWATPSSARERTDSDSQSSALDTLGLFFSRPPDQRTNFNFYIVFIAGALGVAVGAAANWFRHRRKRTPV